MLKEIGITLTDKPLSQVEFASRIVYKDSENKKKPYA